jgi:hypothetical protein
MLTLDLLFDDEAAYHRVLQSPALEPAAMARLYGRPEGTVEVLPYPAALAVNIVMDRLVVSGDIGDRDASAVRRSYSEQYEPTPPASCGASFMMIGLAQPFSMKFASTFGGVRNVCSTTQ